MAALTVVAHDLRRSVVVSAQGDNVAHVPNVDSFQSIVVTELNDCQGPISRGFEI